MRYLTALTILLLELTFATQTVAAGKKALVIGNDQYAELTDLQKAVNDANSVGAALDKIGFTVKIATDLDRDAMTTSINSFVADLKPDDTAFFFYSGHGVSLEDNRNILLPIDVPDTTDPNIVRDKGVFVDETVKRITASGAAVSIFVLDACRDNPFSQMGRGFGLSRGLSLQRPEPGSFILMSADVNEKALDRLSNADPNPNSVFTRHLLPLLLTRGLTLRELAPLVRERVFETAAKVPHRQFPEYSDKLLKNYTLLPFEDSKLGDNVPHTKVERQPAKIDDSEVVASLQQKSNIEAEIDVPVSTGWAAPIGKAAAEVFASRINSLSKRVASKMNGGGDVLIQRMNVNLVRVNGAFPNGEYILSNIAAGTVSLCKNDRCFDSFKANFGRITSGTPVGHFKIIKNPDSSNYSEIRTDTGNFTIRVSKEVSEPQYSTSGDIVVSENSFQKILDFLSNSGSDVILKNIYLTVELDRYGRMQLHRDYYLLDGLGD